MPVRSSAGSSLSACSSDTERHSHSGTPFSLTFLSRAGTPALRKYFWAKTSVATWLQQSGTFTPSHSKITLPSGSTILEVRSVKRSPS